MAMHDDMQLQAHAEQALAMMRAAGFDDAQVTATRLDLDELNVNHNEPSLLRSTSSAKLSLMGIVDGRMASTETTQFDAESMRECAEALFADAKSAPQDAANAVSRGQSARIVQGPQEGSRDMLARTVKDLLDYRVKETPRMMIDEGEASHRLVRWHTLTTGGSDIAGRLGWYSAGAFGTAREGKKSSSFNYTGGTTHDLCAQPVHEQFGIGAMLRDTERQIETAPFAGKFVGDVVLMPNAAEDLLQWFLGQLSDMQLIARSSLYRESVGEAVASKLLTIRSRFDAPGVAAVSGDAFVAKPVTLVEQGVLRTLTPTLYGSRKTGLPHVPVAGGGWDVAPGDTPLAALIGRVQRGALVGRLSMGMPAPNGNFSGVIKNSFAIEGGEVRHALAETMITGNMGRMLQDIVGVSRETQDGTGWRLPWLAIANLHFS
ncbi:MAG TPA: metallopeptidase TldD-related protein [Ramlibacter sp.]|uniref:metallopeptidase TldD-related protein n=1 Tax=Ramlibacter sp. TaxID=1917967 RepID=UPI002C93DE3C|nr:metallopeptidase TldD-related protein [Ramlibacter sp.]HVZ45583.1 metallopeptidase TldD-related protein [Ramlibacter sp.]